MSIPDPTRTRPVMGPDVEVPAGLTELAALLDGYAQLLARTAAGVAELVAELAACLDPEPEREFSVRVDQRVAA